MNDLLIAVFDVREVFAHGLAGNGHEGGVEQVRARQLLHDGPDAARLLQILHERVARGGEVTEVRRFLTDLIDHVQIQLDTSFVGDGGQVQHRVRRAAERHIDRLGVVEGGGRHDIARTDILLDELHDLHARVLGKAQARGVDGGDGAVAAQRHANGLGQAVHGVGGVHARAAAAGGAGVFRIVGDACLIELPGVIGADGLEHVAQA